MPSADSMVFRSVYRAKASDDRIIGGAYEYVCSAFTELVFGTIFWDYSGFAFNLGGRINLVNTLHSFIRKTGVQKCLQGRDGQS